MSIDWSMWEAIGTMLAAVVALFLGLHPILENRNKKPKIEFVYDDTDFVEKSAAVHHYYLRLLNKGPETAKNVHVRLINAVQGNREFINRYERYELFSTSVIQNRDFYSFTFIHNHINESRYVTPAGQDKIFPLARTTFTVLVTGDNLSSFEKTIIVEPQIESKKLKIILDV